MTCGSCLGPDPTLTRHPNRFIDQSMARNSLSLGGDGEELQVPTFIIAAMLGFGVNRFYEEWKERRQEMNLPDPDIWQFPVISGSLELLSGPLPEFPEGDINGS